MSIIISFKDVLCKDEVIVKSEVIYSTKSTEQIKTWKALQMLDVEGFLPKGYLTRVKNSNISYQSARNYAIKVHKSNNLNFGLRCKEIPNLPHKYVLITVIKVA